MLGVSVPDGVGCFSHRHQFRTTHTGSVDNGDSFLVAETIAVGYKPWEDFVYDNLRGTLSCYRVERHDCILPFVVHLLILCFLISFHYFFHTSLFLPKITNWCGVLTIVCST